MKLYQTIIACALLAAGCAKANLQKQAEEKPVQPTGIEKTVETPPSKEKTVFAGEKIIIPGTWSYDVDSTKLTSSPEGIESWIDHFNIKMSYDHTVLKYGENTEDCDIWWNQFSKTKRSLVPKNGARLANLGKVDFNAVTLEDLTSAKYSPRAISGDEDNDQLTPGTVIAIKTNKGNYAKLRIDGYFPLVHKNPEDKDRDIKNYNLKATLVLYKNPQKSE